LVLSLGLGLLAPVSLARAQEEAAPAQKEAAAEGAPAPRFQLGVAFLPVLLGKVATGPSNANTSSDLDFAYGIGLTFSYRVLAGLSVGIAPQALFHLTSKDSAGYGVIDSEKEYDLMGRLAYAHTVARGIDVYAEIMSGYSFVTYNKVILGSQAPRARGSVAAGGVGATFALTGHLFANASLGYQAGFQTSHGMSEKDVMTRFVRLAMGAGVRF
jgi:hypothetical protein